jgi:hypothetical protein
MNEETRTIALQFAQLLTDWRFLRRDQIAWLLPAGSLPLDPLLADLGGGDVLHLEHAPQAPDAQAVYGLGRAGAALAASHLGIDRAGLTKLRRVRLLDRCSCIMPLPSTTCGSRSCGRYRPVLDIP